MATDSRSNWCRRSKASSRTLIRTSFRTRRSPWVILIKTAGSPRLRRPISTPTSAILCRRRWSRPGCITTRPDSMLRLRNSIPPSRKMAEFPSVVFYSALTRNCAIGSSPNSFSTERLGMKENGMPRSKAILIDITKCIGCLSCEAACKQLHGFSQDPEPKLSPTAFTIVEEHGDRYVRRMCMNCQDPACASACLVGALKKTELGPVTYESSKCIGCRYCLVACPFNVPRYQWSKLAPFVTKCDMCYARQAKGQPPACVEACPVQASIVGWRDEILEEAERRILSDTKYVKHIYGSEEVGGISVFYISDVPFEKLGFTKVESQPMPVLTANALGDIPTVVTVGGGLLAGLYWITNRRKLVALAEAAESARSGKGKDPHHD